MKAFQRSSLFFCLALFLTIFFVAAQVLFPQEKSQPLGTPAKKPSSTTQNRKEEVNDDDVIRVKTNLVTVPVTVINHEGKYLQDLKRSDFHVSEDNVEQEIAFFSDSESPLGIVVLIDTSDSVSHVYDVIGKAVNALIDQLRPDDTVFPVAFDSIIRAPLQKSTSDKVLLRNTIRDLLGKPSGGSGSTRIYDAIEFINKHLLPSRGGRNVVIVYSDGIDTRSIIGTRRSTLYDVAELGAPYYTFRFYSSGSGSLRAFMGDEFIKVEQARTDGRKYLRDLAERSGGRSTVADSHFPDLIKEAYIALGDELLHQYFISYYPKQSAATNQRRQIEARVDRSRVKVRARSSYIYEPLDK